MVWSPLNSLKCCKAQNISPLLQDESSLWCLIQTSKWYHARSPYSSRLPSRISGKLDERIHNCGDKSNHLKHLKVKAIEMLREWQCIMDWSTHLNQHRPIKINNYDETKQTPCHHDAWPKHQNGCGKIIVLIALSCPTTKFHGPKNLEGLIYACIIPNWCIKCIIYLSHETC